METAAATATPAAPPPPAPAAAAAPATPAPAAAPAAPAAAPASAPASAAGDDWHKGEAAPVAAPAGTPAPTAQAADADFELKMPEGLAANHDSVAKFKSIQKDTKLTPQQRAEASVKLLAETQRQAYQQQLAGWKSETLGLPQFKEQVAPTAKRGLQYLESKVPGFTKGLESSGHIWRKDMVQALYVIGQSLAEDTSARGSPFSGAQRPHDPRSSADGFYDSPDMPANRRQRR